MRDHLKFWFKYFAFISFLGICVNLIYLIVPIYMMVIYDRVLYSFSPATLITLSALTFFSLIIMGILDFIRSRMLLKAGLDMEQKLFPHVLDTMHTHAMAAEKSGYSSGMQDLMHLTDAIKSYKILRFMDFPWMVIYLVGLYAVHPIIGLVATTGLVMVSLFQFLLRVLNKKRYIAAQPTVAAANRFLAATLRNAELIIGMGMLTQVAEKFIRTDAHGRINRYEADSNRCAIGAVKVALQGMFTAGIFGTGAYLFFIHELSVGMIFASVILMIRLFSPLDLSLESIKSSVEALAAYKRLSHFVDMKEMKSTLSLPRPEGRLQADGISLVVGNRTLLRNISLQVEPGETLGVFGPSASGKTSLARVILGIWPPMTGKMRLDGAEIAQWQREKLGAYLGYLPQETDFFPGTIAENISRLKTVDADKVILAAQKALCHDMILRFPQGYDFMIDTAGRNLSCGQRQQIALARALYDDPQVVVLDEPHLNLDDAGFKSLFMTLQTLRKEKKTVVVVTDRSNLLINTDKLLMLKDGQVALFGPSKDVLAALTKQQQQATTPSPRQQVQAPPLPEQISQN